LLQYARNAAFDLISEDADLEKPENTEIRKQLLKMVKERPNWSRIS